MVKGKKSPLTVELVVQKKFKEERLVSRNHTSEYEFFLLFVTLYRWVFLSSTRLSIRRILSFNLDRLWRTTDSTLIIHLQFSDDCLQVWRAKKLLRFLPNNIYLEVDLTCLKVGEFKKASEQVVAARKGDK